MKPFIRCAPTLIRSSCYGLLKRNPFLSSNREEKKYVRTSFNMCALFRFFNSRQYSTSTYVSVADENNEQRAYVPRRAMLYVPGSDRKKLDKISALDVDCVVMDCEDGVAMNRKEEARETIRELLDKLNFGRAECAVRVNPVNSGLIGDDLEAVCAAERLPQTLMLPKVETPTDMELLSVVLKRRPDSSPKINLVIFIESARGILNMQAICQHGMEISRRGAYQLDAAVFGSDDLCANIGATRTPEATELLYARQKFLLTAKAFGLQAIDLVHIDFKDLESLRKQSEEGARMGFTGKQVIHPGQIPIVQDAFSPSKDKLEWATELTKAFEEHHSTGKGAFTFRGQMIDMPSLRQARNVLQLMQSIKR